MNKSKILYLITLLVVSFLGYQLGHIFFSGEDDLEIQSEKHNAQEEEIEIKKTFGKNFKKLENNKFKLMKNDKENLSLRDALLRNGLLTNYNSLRPYFPESKVGNELLEYSTVFEFHIVKGHELSIIAKEKMDYLRSHPEEAVEALKVVFDRLPNKFSNEKQRLLQFASRFEMSESVKTDFLFDEIKRPLTRDQEGLIEGTSLFNTTIAFRSLANVLGNDPGKLGPYLIEAVESHGKDLETQMALIHFYSRYDPIVARELKDKYEIKDRMKSDSE